MDIRNPRIGIIGSGAIGGFYGLMLAQAGFDVHFLLRSEYRIVHEHGMAVDSAVHGQLHMKVQAYGWLRGHDEVAVVDGDPAERRFVAVYRTDDRVTGALAVGMPPKEIRRWRQTHQPLGLPSAGSVFRNPEGDSAGRLIEAAGLKDFRIGGAVVSEKHANFIVNDQKGTAADVRRVGDHVRGVVAESSGVELVYEVEFVGDWDGWPWPA